MVTADKTQIGSVARPKCASCGGEGVVLHEMLHDHLFGAPGLWSFKKCVDPGCGLVWLDPMPLPEEIGRAYANYYTHSFQAGSTRPGFLKRVYRFMKRGYLAGKYGYSMPSRELLARFCGTVLYLFPVQRGDVDAEVRFLHARPGGRVLDVGCGAGEWLVMMRELGWCGEGVDFDPNAVEEARQKGLNVRAGTLEEQGYPPNHFDAVTLNHVIEHVPDPLALLKECQRILKPGGKLVLATPNVESWGHRYFKEHWRGLEPPRHLHLMSPQAARRFLVESGFGQVKVSTHNAHYVWHHTYRLWRFRKREAQERQPLPMIPWVLTLMEQLLLPVNPTRGECISSVAIKS